MWMELKIFLRSFEERDKAGARQGQGRGEGLPQGAEAVLARLWQFSHVLKGRGGEDGIQDSW